MKSKQASSSLCSSCLKRASCAYFSKYVSSDGSEDFSIEVLECEDFSN
ncbi:MAG: hypothetical protein QXW00_00455 [Candidatus Woesearchaeota archaeon]